MTRKASSLSRGISDCRSSGIDPHPQKEKYLGTSASALLENLTASSSPAGLEVIVRPSFKPKGLAFERRFAHAVDTHHKLPGGDMATLSEYLPMYQATAPMVILGFMPKAAA